MEMQDEMDAESRSYAGPVHILNMTKIILLDSTALLLQKQVSDEKWYFS